MVLSCPVTWARIWTVAKGSAVPTAGMVTGTAFETARAVTTGTGPPPPAPRPPRPPAARPPPAPLPVSPAGGGSAPGSFEHDELEKPAKRRQTNANPAVRDGRKQERA